VSKTLCLIGGALIVCLNSPFEIPLAVILSCAGYLRSKRKLWVLLLMAVVIEPNLRAYFPVFQSGIVSDLNATSVLVTHGHQKILVNDATFLWVGDQVTLSEWKPIEPSSAPGDRTWNAYVESLDIVGTASAESVIRVERSDLMTWILKQWANVEGFASVARMLLFQSDPLSEFGLIVGTGLIYRLVNQSLRSVLSLVFREATNNGWRLGLYFILAWILGYPIGLLRFLVSTVCVMTIKNRWNRWSACVAVLWMIDSCLLTSMAVLIPLFFQALSTLQMEGWSSRVSFGWFQGLVWHRVSLLLTLMYPIWQWGVTLGFVCVWIGTFLPGFQGLTVVGVRGLSEVMRWVKEVWTLRGHASIPTLTALLMVLKLAKWTPHLRAAWLFAGLVWLPGLSAPWLATLSVIDVGQGNAVLLSSPWNRSVVLIDTGRSFALRKVTSILDQNGIARIDTLVITHDDADHRENLGALMKDYRWSSLITTPQDHDLEAVRLTSLDASVLNPDENQRSLVFGITWGTTRFLLMGDADGSNEQALLSRYPQLRTDVLLLGHHGSASSTTDDWLGSLQPRLAVISVGSNRYGHPAPSVLDRLKAFQIPTLTTHKEGTLRFIITPWGTLLLTDSWNLKVLR
jgi:beta-lactamase superfamily II metal-dependent hydrolase